MGVNKLIDGTKVKYTRFLRNLLKRKPVIAIGSLFVFSLIFALMPDAAAAGGTTAGVGEFRLGEVLDESIGWFIVVGLGAIFAGVISAEITPANIAPRPTTINQPIDSSKTSPSLNSPTPADVPPAAAASGINANIKETTNKLPSTKTGFLFNRISTKLVYLTLVPTNHLIIPTSRPKLKIKNLAGKKLVLVSDQIFLISGILLFPISNPSRLRYLSVSL